MSLHHVPARREAEQDRGANEQVTQQTPNIQRASPVGVCSGGESVWWWNAGRNVLLVQRRNGRLLKLLSVFQLVTSALLNGALLLILPLLIVLAVVHGQLRFSWKLTHQRVGRLLHRRADAQSLRPSPKWARHPKPPRRPNLSGSRQNQTNRYILPNRASAGNRHRTYDLLRGQRVECAPKRVPMSSAKMIRTVLFLLAAIAATNTGWAGELRTGRGVRTFTVAEPEKAKLAGAAQSSLIRESSLIRVSQQTPLGTQSAGGDEAGSSELSGVELPPLSPRTTSLEGDFPIETWGAGSCGECGECSQCANYWFAAEFLLWWRRGRAVPPLASTNVLGAGSVLFGDETVGDRARPGARFELGGFLNYDHSSSLSGRVWGLGESRVRFDSNSLAAGTTVVRPFVDVEPGSPTLNQETGLPIDGIGGSTGSMQVTSDANVWGAEALYRCAFYRDCNTRGDVVFGYQSTRIDEDVAINHNFTNAGIQIIGRDIFDTKNEFHGAVLGIEVISRQGPWTIDLLAKVGIGDMHQRVNISGFEIRDDGITEQTFNGSLLALPSNIGFRERNKFAVVPELGVKSRWQAHPDLELSLGYSFVYWSDVMQAGDIIDRVVNGSQTSGGALSGTARPAFVFQDGTYWVHGLNFGLTWSY